MKIRSNNTSFDKLRTEVKDFFHPFTMGEMLNYSKELNPDHFFRKIKLFTEQNQQGISSSQMRQVFDRIDQSPDVSKISFRSFLAFSIVRQTEDSARKILLLLEMLAEHIIRQDKDVEEHSIYQKQYREFALILLAYHRFANDGFHKKEKRMMDTIYNEFKAINNIKDLLSLKTSFQIPQLLQLLKSFVTKYGKKIKTHQLRRIYDEVLAVKNFVALKKLQALLVYTVARQERFEGACVIFLIYKLLVLCEEQEVDGFKRLIETIVAYHKYSEKISSYKEKNLQQIVQDYFKNQQITFHDLLYRRTSTQLQIIESKLQAFISQYQYALSNSQLRNVYELIRELNNAQAIQLAQPRMAFILGRQAKDEPKEIIFLLYILTGLVDDNNVKNYKELMEDIIAYHEYFATDISTF